MMLFDRPAWQERAACRGLTELFFPTRGADVAMPKAICDECPVRAECLACALENGEKWGVWGGLSERQRRRVRNPRPRSTTAKCGTESGATAHVRAGERPCDACRMAKNRAENARQKLRRERLRAARQGVGLVA